MTSRPRAFPGDMPGFPFEAVLDELIFEYGQMTGDSNPCKQSLALDEQPAGPGHVMRRFANVMGAVLSDGSFGSKTVFIDEDKGKTGGTVRALRRRRPPPVAATGRHRHAAALRPHGAGFTAGP